jgi:nucleoside-diphosphate-sugar epimerase
MATGMPQRILVTGATGFVGRHLMSRLRHAFPDATLLAAERGGAPLCPVADAYLPIDLQQPESLDALVAQAAPDAVVHLAAQAAVGAAFADPVYTWRVNLLGTLALASSVLKRAPEATFLFISSAEIYGLSFRDIDAALDENAPMRPANPYAASKAACDIALGEMALRGLRCVRMRPSNHTGAGQSDSFVVPAFARQIARIEAGVAGAGDARRRAGPVAGLQGLVQMRRSEHLLRCCDGSEKSLFAPRAHFRGQIPSDPAPLLRRSHRLPGHRTRRPRPQDDPPPLHPLPGPHGRDRHP